LARSYSWRYRSGDPAAGRWRAAHARGAGNQRLLALGDVALVDVAGNLGGHHRVIAQRGSGGLYDIARPEACLAVGCSSLGTFSSHFTELVGVPPSIHRRQAARATAGCRLAWRTR
jgi:hypothetical protein